MCARSGHALEIRQSIESEIDLAGRSAKFVTAHSLDKLSRQLVFVHQLGEGHSGIDAGGNDIGVDLIAIGKHDALGSPILYQNFRNASLGANFDSGFAGGIADCIGDSAGASAGESPGTECT